MPLLIVLQILFTGSIVSCRLFLALELHFPWVYGEYKSNRAFDAMSTKSIGSRPKHYSAMGKFPSTNSIVSAAIDAAAQNPFLNP
jgi:hypothetical protein